MRTKKTPLIVFNMQTIRSFKPCYDPSVHLKESWNGTVIDILRNKSIPNKDKLWLACREELLSASLLRQFAVNRAKSVRKYVPIKERKEFDRILRVCSRFAAGNATQEELKTASRVAYAEYAKYAALDAASYAAANAASYAVCAASYAAVCAAHTAAVEQLIEMVLAE